MTEQQDQGGATGADDRCRLYLITPPALSDLDVFAADLAAALAAGDVACLQLRLKEASDDQIKEAARRLMPIAHAEDVAFIINDRADLAAEVSADGVHLGEGDGDIATARSLLGADGIIGASCYDSMDLAFQAGDQGADYVAFGSFFDSPTKENSRRPTPDILSVWDEVTELPSVAIGGITADNLAPIVKARAHFIAVSSAVWASPTCPADAVARLNSAIDQASAARG